MTPARRRSIDLAHQFSVSGDLKPSMKQFLIYALFGAAATLVHYTVLVSLVEMALLSPPPAAFVGALCGALVGFILNYKITFAASNPLVEMALMRFLLTAAVGAFVSAALVWVCVELFQWHYLVAQILATVLLLVLTYQVNRRWSFVR